MIATTADVDMNGASLCVEFVAAQPWRGRGLTIPCLLPLRGFVPWGKLKCSDMLHTFLGDKGGWR